jgi:hypothetical protein
MNDSVVRWLSAFRAEPVQRLNDLVVGRAAVPAWSHASLREIFPEIFESESSLLDQALADWVAQAIAQPAPKGTPVAVWASHLQDVFRGVAGTPLPTLESLLRQRLQDFQIWLEPLRFAESCDPLAAYYTALAWSDTNQGLEDRLWCLLVLRRNHEPAYYVDIGLIGLSRARDAQGRLAEKASDLLLLTLLNLADSGMEQGDWEMITRSILIGYQLSDVTWAREFQRILAKHRHGKNGAIWVAALLRVPVMSLTAGRVDDARGLVRKAQGRFARTSSGGRIRMREYGPDLPPPGPLEPAYPSRTALFRTWSKGSGSDRDGSYLGFESPGGAFSDYLVQTLADILKRTAPEPMLVECDTERSASVVSDFLRLEHIECRAIASNVPMYVWVDTLRQFEEGRFRVLLAADRVELTARVHRVLLDRSSNRLIWEPMGGDPGPRPESARKRFQVMVAGHGAHTQVDQSASRFDKVVVALDPDHQRGHGQGI